MKQKITYSNRHLLINLCIGIALVLLTIAIKNAPAYAVGTSYQSWNIPENNDLNNDSAFIAANDALKVVPFGKPFIAPNGNYWFLTQATGGYRMLNYADSTGTIRTPAFFKYVCCVNGSPSPQESDDSYFISDSTGRVWYTGADYGVYKVNLDVNGNPVSFGTRTWLPPATGPPPAAGPSNWGPSNMQMGPDDTFWYVNNNTNIKNTQQDGTLIREFTSPRPIEGMRFDGSGNLWMATDTTGTVSISKLEVASGTFTHYPLDYAAGYNVTLQTLGPDGNMWFIHDNINIVGNPMAVGKITPSGVITYPAGLFASDIAAGHENTIVMTSNDFNKVQIYDVVSQQFKTYGQSNQNGFHLPAKSINNHEYWYVSKHYPKLTSYTGTVSYAVTKATLDEKNATATITAPKNNSYFSTNSIAINTAISDPNGLTKVELYVNGILAETVNNPTNTQTINWNTSSFSDGQYILFVRVYDPAGSTEDSAVTTIALDRDATDGFTPGIEKTLVDRSTTNGSLAQIIEGPDKKIWGMFNGNKIARFDPCTEIISTFTSPLRSGTQASLTTAAAMLSASNGKIYYVDRSNNGISTISTDGVITQFPSLPGINDAYNTSPASITDLVEGPDGNIWYAAYGLRAVGYMDKDGNYLGQVSLGTINPGDLTVGNDGSIWVTQGSGTGAKALTKIDSVSKAKTAYTAPKLGPSTSFQFADIKLGPDGNIWFTARQTGFDYIGKVTNTGVFTTYVLPTVATATVPTPGKKPYTITPDTSGKIWFSFGGSPDPYGIGYVDTSSGVVTEYVDNTNLNTAAGLVTGSDNSIYFAKSSFGSAIGRINLGKPADCTAPTVQITTPTNNSFTSANSVDVTVESSDATSVKEIKTYQNSTLISTISNPAVSELFSLDISGLSDGTYNFSATAKDVMDLETTSSSVSLTVDRTKPVVSITSPSSNAKLTGIATISASAADTNGIAGVQFKLNGSPYGTEDTTAPYSLSWDTTSFTNGAYTISAVARDIVGNSIESVALAASVENKDITICHFPGTRDERTMSVSATAISGHLEHGDYTGRCIPIATANAISQQANPTFNTLDDVEELEEISVMRQADNTVLATIDEGYDLSGVNLELRNDETLKVDGLLGSVNVKQGATIKGNGSVKSLVIDEGAYLAPGSSPGCLTSEGLLLEGTYTFELGGVVACTEHDQVIVNGGVTLNGILEIKLEEGFKPEIGQSFIIIKNDDTDAISSTFTGISEGGSIEIAGVTYSVSYIGGDGNDVELNVANISEDTVESNTKPEAYVTEDKPSSTVFLALGAVLTIAVVSIVALFGRPAKK